MNTDMHKDDGKDGIIASVLDRIKEESITPTPRWQFLAREASVWTIGVASFCVGALALAGLIFEVRYAGWELYEATHPSLLSFAVEMLPYAWVVLFLIFAASAYLFLRHTKRGYRFSYAGLLVMPVIASGFFGIFLYKAGAGYVVEEYISDYVPFHQSTFARERTLWTVPSQGRIAGVIQEVSAPRDVIMLSGMDGNDYLVNITAFRDEDRARMEVGDQLRILGVPTSTPGALDGCVIFMRDDEMFRRFPGAAPKPPALSIIHQLPERNVFVARSTNCADIEPFSRLRHFEPENASQ